VLLLSEVVSVTKDGDSYTAKVKSSPRYVTDDCIGCGKCVEVCPVDGKAIFPPKGSGQPRVHWIDRSRCLHFKKGQCSKCADVCPTKAVAYDDRATSVTRKVSAVVYATGMKPVEACDTTRLGCGVIKDVVSSVDAERILNEKGRLVRPSDATPPKRVAMVQCVGSRTVKTGVEYCSKFCCKYATKISQLMLETDPELSIDFYFMDLRTLYEPQDDFKVWAKARKTVKLIRSMPATVNLREDGKLLLRAAAESDADVTEAEYDMVILSVGMRPEGGRSELASSLGIKADAYGFATASPDLERQGVFVVGTVSGPMDIEETSVRAVAAAERIPDEKGVQ
jgi:heterodisulfide reductase subunit A